MIFKEEKQVVKNLERVGLIPFKCRDSFCVQSPRLEMLDDLIKKEVSYSLSYYILSWGIIALVILSSLFFVYFRNYHAIGIFTILSLII